VLIIQMKPVKYFVPNYVTDQDFGETLGYVKEMGVCLLAYDCIVGPDSMVVDSSVECRLRII
jgi:sugar fermentation stimulation protein A